MVTVVDENTQNPQADIDVDQMVNMANQFANQFMKGDPQSEPYRPNSAQTVGGPPNTEPTHTPFAGQGVRLDGSSGTE